LTRVALRAELVVTGKGLQRRPVGNRSLKPLRYVILFNPHRRFGHAGLAAILLSEDVNGNLAPIRRDGDLLGLKNDGSVGIDDPRTPRLEF